VSRANWLRCLGVAGLPLLACFAIRAVAQTPAQAPATPSVTSTQEAPAAAVPAAPGTPATVALPSAQVIFDNYAKAIGGKEAWMKLNSRVTRGTVRIEGVDGTGTLLEYERAPNQSFSTITLASGALVREGFDGKEGWEQDQNGTVKVVEGARAADIRAESDFYFEVDLDKVYPHAKTTGQRTADGRLAYVVEASAPGGTLRWLYFDAETWLRFRTDVFDNALSLTPTTIERADEYRDVDGIKYPYKGSVQGTGANLTYRCTVLKHNVTVTDDEVARPRSASN
jgi:hypothetical protein